MSKEAYIKIVATASTIEETISIVKRLEVDVILMDINLTDNHSPQLITDAPPSPFMEVTIATFALFVIGWGSFGVLTLRAKVLSRWGALFLMAGPMIGGATLGNILAQPLWAVGLILLGVSLWVSVKARDSKVDLGQMLRIQ